MKNGNGTIRYFIGLAITLTALSLMETFPTASLVALTAVAAVGTLISWWGVSAITRSFPKQRSDC